MLLFQANPALAGHGEGGPAKKAIVLAAFGTSYTSAFQSILHIRDAVQKANPDIPVKLAFTSSIIRNIWHKRQTDEAWKKANPNIPEDVLYVKSPLATLANLSDNGYKDITVQSMHVYAGEEFTDLKAIVAGLQSIKTIKHKCLPFTDLHLGRPALGMPGDAYPYMDDIAVGVKALAADVAQAKKEKVALVYMGHGNDFFSTGIYAQFEKAMRDEYDYPIYVATVEGYPGFDLLLPRLKHAGVKKVLLKPFMIVAGDHANNDMAGDDADSWKSELTKAGIKVHAELRGLGMVDPWAAIYVNHVKDAMAQ